MPFAPSRGEYLFVKAAVLIVVGVGVGMADAFFFRPINLKALTPPPIEGLLGDSSKAGDSEAVTPPKSDGGEEPVGEDAPDEGTSSPEDAPDGPQVVDAEPTEPVKDTPAPVEAAPMKEGHITIDQAYALYQRDPRGEGAQVIFIDARSMDKYETGHVAGAVPMGLESFQAGDPPQLDMLRSMNPNAVFVVYCLGGECHESEEVALLMNNSGFPTTYIMHDGIPAWRDAGHPVETGKHPFHDAYGFR